MTVDVSAGADDGGHLSFALLGTVRAYRAAVELDVGSPRQRAVLAMLAVRVNQVVSRDELVDGVWGSDPPITVVNAVHILVSALRKVLEPARPRRAPARLLASVGSGYRLTIAPAQIDAAVFEGQLRTAEALCGTDDMAGALRAYDASLEVWGGTPLSGFRVPSPRLNGPG